MKVEDNSTLLLNKAAEDVRVFEHLMNSDSIHDETLGFHAQQAIEKACKAVLNYSKVKYSKTHDLSELSRILDENKISRPFDDASIEFLTPYATSLCYEDSSDQSMDRQGILTLIQQVFKWAEQRIKSPVPLPEI